MEKRIKLINNIFFYSTIILAGVVMAKTYYDRSKLPEGVCPITNNQTIYYLAIILLIISFIVNMIISIKYKVKK